jgi:hypothetical protein
MIHLRLKKSHCSIDRAISFVTHPSTRIEHTIFLCILVEAKAIILFPLYLSIRTNIGTEAEASGHFFGGICADLLRIFGNCLCSLKVPIKSAISAMAFC